MSTNMPTALDSFTAKVAGGVVGSAHINNLQDGLLAVERITVGPVWANARYYGATGDGTTDDSAAIQSAIDALTTGGVCYVPPGTYKLSTKLDLDTAQVELRGAGAGATILKVVTATTVGIDINADRVKVRDLSLQHATTTATAGAAIRLTGGGYADIDGVTFYGGWYRNIECLDGFAFTVGANCRLFDHLNSGIWHGQTTSSDRGDSVIEACTIDTGSGGATYGVFWESGGGLRVLGAKILAHINGVMVDIKSGVATQGVYVRGCSIENCTGYGIRMKRAAGTPTLVMVSITDNQLDVAGDGISLESAGLALAQVSDNNIRVPNTKTGINIGAAVASTTVANNTVNGALVGIAVAADAQAALIGNQFYSCTTMISNLAGQDSDAGVCDQEYQFHLPSNTSTTVYDPLIEVALGDYRSCTVMLNFDLILNGVGEATSTVIKKFRRAAGACTVSDVVAAVSAGSVFDVQYDTATVSGSVQIGIRRNSGAGGTAILGQVTMRLLGHAKTVKAI